MNLREDVKKFIRVTARRAGSLFVAPPQVVQLTPEALLADVSTRSVLDQFHQLWYSSVGEGKVRWMGRNVLKNPFDLWIVQDILFERRPDLLIETGTHQGGSALYYASMARAMGMPLRIVTIDFNPKIDFDAPALGITVVAGISTTSATLERVKAEIAALRQSLGREPKVMVALDSDHSKENVAEELKTYSPFVSVGQYLIVEDTNVNGHPVFASHGPGPWEAADEFLRGRSDFVRDSGCHKFLFTLNPDGWLLRTQ